MAIPDYQGWMLPLLQAVADGQDHVLRDLLGQLADKAGLTTAERRGLLPSGQQTVISNRVQWAKTYLKKAGLLMQPRRGVIRITPEGKAVLSQKPASIDTAFLKRYPDFVSFYQQVQPAQEAADTPDTPEEALEAAHLALRSALADELLDRLKTCSPWSSPRIVDSV